ncbi:hypothetical protein AB0L40_26025 [Patulibacter sp. NPDC049589]|uniref:hypothetical protein n=1 Tax=Patulibacter sp. NPDC049589 TaxID=3154731 RepID=UPI003415B204
MVVVLLVPAWGEVDHGCRVSPPPLSGPPDPGTPRAGYCDALDGAWRWIVLVVLPTALVAATTVAFRRRLPVVPLAIAALVCGGAIANWVAFDDLDWALTV